MNLLNRIGLVVCSWSVVFATTASAETVNYLKPVNYSKHVAPILWKRCAGCHRPGEVGPFSLLTYKDAAKRADFIADITATKRMPPWKPEPGFGEFVDEQRLTDSELKTLAAWAAAGAPEGNPSELPPPPKFPEGWQLGTPDLVVKMPQAFEVPAEGRDVFRSFVIPMGVDADRTVAAVEFHPGNAKVVHHALFFLDSSGQGRKLDEADPGPGYKSFGGIGFIPTGSLGGWAPGAQPRRLRDNMGRLLAKGSDLVLQVHYHPDGKVELDQSELGVYFTQGPARKIVAAIMLGNREINIPAGESHYRLTSSVILPREITAVGITPHMHWLGREMKIHATLPDARIEHLLWIKDWDFNWQGQYLYRHDIPLPQGTRLDLEAYYDNSTSNPANPNNPPKDVTFGEQTTNEMCFCWVNFYADKRADYIETMRAGWQQVVASRLSRYLPGSSPPSDAKPLKPEKGGK